MTVEQPTAVYVYGFVPAGEVSISAPGVDGTVDVKPLKLGAIAAVVSPIALEEVVGPEAEDRMSDLEWVAPRALRHQQVVEELMRTSAVLPLTFGVVFSSEQALAEAVRTHEEHIAEFLDYAADKAEWAVKVYANPRRQRAYVEQSKPFRDRLQRLPESPGARYLQEKRLERELDALAANERREAAERVRESLATAAVAVRNLRIPSRQFTGRDDEVVLNTAFLARADQIEGFLESVERLADEYRPRGLTVEATGPWPPYSFCPSLQVPS